MWREGVSRNSENGIIASSSLKIKTMHSCLISEWMCLELCMHMALNKNFEIFLLPSEASLAGGSLNMKRKKL